MSSLQEKKKGEKLGAACDFAQGRSDQTLRWIFNSQRQTYVSVCPSPRVPRICIPVTCCPLCCWHLPLFDFLRLLCTEARFTGDGRPSRFFQLRFSSYWYVFFQIFWLVEPIYYIGTISIYINCPIMLFLAHSAGQYITTISIYINCPILHQNIRLPSAFCPNLKPVT